MTRKLLAAAIAALALTASLAAPADAKDITWGYVAGTPGATP